MTYLIKPINLRKRNMQLVLNEKDANRMQPRPVRENMQLGQAQDNMQPVPSVGKHATGAKRGKSCNRCQARENMQPVHRW